MNIYAYDFRAFPGEGASQGRWELRLLHNGQIVETIHYTSDDSEVVDEAVKRGQEWVAEMERFAPPS